MADGMLPDYQPPAAGDSNMLLEHHFPSSRRRTGRGILTHAVLWPALLMPAVAGDAATEAGRAAEPEPVPLTLRVALEPAPSGGWTQIQVFADPPSAIAQGSLALKLDSAVFGPIERIAVFSAAGDAIGYGTIRDSLNDYHAPADGRYIAAHFSSLSGGIGRLPGQPVFVARVPVLPGIPEGTAATVTVSPDVFVEDEDPQDEESNVEFGPYPVGNQWLSPAGVPYQVTVDAGEFTVGADLSIANVTPGGGLLHAGSVVRIDGNGFDSMTTVEIAGTGVNAVRYISPTRLDVALGVATELTGRLVRVTNGAGESTGYFASPPSTESPGGNGIFPPLDGIHAIVPLRTHRALAITYPPRTTQQGAALLNPTPDKVEVRVLRSTGISRTPSSDVIVIPPGEIRFPGFVLGAFDAAWFLSPVPIRMLRYNDRSSNAGPLGPGRIQITEPGGFDLSPPAIELSPSSSDIEWFWQIGTPPPDPWQPRVYASSNGVSGTYEYAASVSGGDWLKVTPKRGTTYDGTDNSQDLTISVEPVGLAPGTYHGTITLVPEVPSSLEGFQGKPGQIEVALHVTAEPELRSDRETVSSSSYGGAAAEPQMLRLVTNGDPAAFTLTTSGEPWFSVSPLQGEASREASAELTFIFNPDGLAEGEYHGSVTVTGPANSFEIPVRFIAYPPLDDRLRVTVPTPITITREEGESDEFVSGSLINVDHTGGVPLKVEVHTESGGDWLTFQLFEGAGVPETATITARALVGDLAPAVYRGTLTITSSKTGSVTVEVIFTVLAKPTQPPVLLSPAPSSITTPAWTVGVSEPFTVRVGDGPVIFRSGSIPFPDPNRFTFGAVSATLDSSEPGVYTYHAETGLLPPGTYHSGLTFSNAAGSLTVPIDVHVTATEDDPPLLGSIVSAASGLPGPLSPGELITIHGAGIGPAPAGLNLTPDGTVATELGNTQVLINGQPAPLTYASVDQINASVPYEVARRLDPRGVTTIQVVTGGVATATWERPVVPTAPALFTLNATGSGPAAVLNQDGSVNSPANPAPRGTVVQIYATGEGELSPAATTGSVTDTPSRPLSDVSVAIGGVAAPVQFAGSAPGFISGVLQINAAVPRDAPTGPALPILVRSDGRQSQAPATISIE